ncbi:hypothetical protein BASA82_000362 [Batrachochytrium salamandrivorans]|nr:hypothetical protein BASA81_002923 [Batrachochytrium salamandrivorans]KAH9262614.1 hypothetical protein BASA82_000362 [Batrachochytrium salamandrivorans]
MAGLVWYRTLLRTTRELFKGDQLALIKSHQELRSKFEQSRHLTDQEQINELFEMCEDANKFMRNNVVQATKTERGNWAVDIKDPNVDNTNPSSRSAHVLMEPIHPQEALDRMNQPPSPPSLQIKTNHFRKS